MSVLKFIESRQKMWSNSASGSPTSTSVSLSTFPHELTPTYTPSRSLQPNALSERQGSFVHQGSFGQGTESIAPGSKGKRRWSFQQPRQAEDELNRPRSRDSLNDTSHRLSFVDNQNLHEENSIQRLDRAQRLIKLSLGEPIDEPSPMPRREQEADTASDFAQLSISRARDIAESAIHNASVMRAKTIRSSSPALVPAAARDRARPASSISLYDRSKTVALNHDSSKTASLIITHENQQELQQRQHPKPGKFSIMHLASRGYKIQPTEPSNAVETEWAATEHSLESNSQRRNWLERLFWSLAPASDPAEPPVIDIDPGLTDGMSNMSTSESPAVIAATTWDDESNEVVDYLNSPMDRFTHMFLDNDIESRWREYYHSNYQQTIRCALLFGLPIWSLCGLLVTLYGQHFKSLTAEQFNVMLAMRIVCLVISAIWMFAVRRMGTYFRSWLRRVLEFLSCSLFHETPYHFMSSLMLAMIGLNELVVYTLEGNNTQTGLVLILLLLPFISASSLRHPAIVTAGLSALFFISYATLTLAASAWSSDLSLILILIALLGNNSIFTMFSYREETRDRNEFLAYCKLAQEESINQRLLLKMLPLSIISKLRLGAEYVFAKHDNVSVLFTHIHDFDLHTASMQPLQLVRTLNRIFSIFDALTDEHHVYKVETIGDVFLVCSNCPAEFTREDHASSLCLLAMDMMEVVRAFLVTHDETRRSSIRELERGETVSFVKPPHTSCQQLDVPVSIEATPLLSRTKIELRIGINTGPVIAGVVGRKHPRYRLMGDTINTASRMSTTCKAGEIQINSSTRAQLPVDDFDCEARSVEVKGKGRMDTFICAPIGFRTRFRPLLCSRPATLQRLLPVEMGQNRPAHPRR